MLGFITKVVLSFLVIIICDTRKEFSLLFIIWCLWPSVIDVWQFLLAAQHLSTPLYLSVSFNPPLYLWWLWPAFPWNASSPSIVYNCHLGKVANVPFPLHLSVVIWFVLTSGMWGEMIGVTFGNRLLRMRYDFLVFPYIGTNSLDLIDLFMRNIKCIKLLNDQS